MIFTVFTPTYNRAYMLPKLYNSLVQQIDQNFEWIIIDDGSEDETETLVKTWIDENKLHIKYFKQLNGGKHRAINMGVNEANGKLFFIVDSDDYLPKTAVQQVLENFKIVGNQSKIAGVAGRRLFQSGKIVGNSTFDTLISNSLDIRYLHKVSGDLVEVFRTDVLKQFPFPEIENEKFCPEALVWNRIAQNYKLLFFNQGIYITEYLADGLTSKIVKIRMQSPIASMLCYSELASYKIPLTQKIKATINFWRFAFSSKISFFKKLNQVNFSLSIIALPLGLLMHVKDLKKTR